MRKLRTIEMRRLSVEEFRAAEKFPLVVVLDDIRSMYNIGSIFRTADAFRIEGIVLCGLCAVPPGAEIHKTALGAEESVTWRYSDTAVSAVTALRAAGYVVYAAEQAVGSTPLNTFIPRVGERYAVVFGNEVKGVRQDVIDACDGCLEIPQFGTKHSMNVAVAAGIVMYSMVSPLFGDEVGETNTRR